MSPRAYDRRTRDAAREETRRRIVEAAFRLHGEHGVLRTSHAMIAKAAAVSVPTVYNHFPTLPDLLAACTRHVPPGTPRLGPHVLEGKRDLPARVRAVVAAVFEAYAFWEPWLRWGYAESVVVPELKRFLDGWRAGRLALVREALAPGFRGAPPVALLRLADALLDFPAWQTLSAGPHAAAAASDALLALASRFERRKGSS